MATVFKTRVIKIGNSQGIRIPKPLLNQTRLDETKEVTLEVQADDTGTHLIVRPVRHPRAGWDAAFQAMAAHGDAEWLDGELVSTSTWDEEEWEW